MSIFPLFGVSIAGLLAFGGLGGIMVGFAAKDMLANLFGSLMLFMDRPFDASRSLVVNLSALDNASLNLTITAYAFPLTYADFLALQQQLYLDIVKCVHEQGARWAYENSTTCLIAN